MQTKMSRISNNNKHLLDDNIDISAILVFLLHSQSFQIFVENSEEIKYECEIVLAKFAKKDTAFFIK